MRVDARELHELVVEQRLLRSVVRLVRRCEGRPPTDLLDAVLAGTCGARPAVPEQRRPAHRRRRV